MEAARPRRDRDDGPRRGPVFPPLSTTLRLPPGFDPEANADASVPYHRLFVQNVAYGLSQSDVAAVFEPFGHVEFVDMHMDHVSVLQLDTPILGVSWNVVEGYKLTSSTATRGARHTSSTRRSTRHRPRWTL